MKKSSKQLLFEMMHKVAGMPLKEFANVQTATRYPVLFNFMSDTQGYNMFLHTTDSQEKANSICSKGFQYQVFDKTTDYVTNPDDIDYLISMRKAYGNFIVVIQIRSNVSSYESISTNGTDEDGEDVYVLPPQYIKGYYDKLNNRIYPNPLFKK
jgi:hypothetical protein